MNNTLAETGHYNDTVVRQFSLMAVFAWALHAGQLDDLRGEAERILVPDGPDLDAHQPPH